MAQVVSYGGIDEGNSNTSCSVVLEEMVAWGCRNGRFNEQFQILPLIEVHLNAFVCISDGFRSTCSIYICYASC